MFSLFEKIKELCQNRGISINSLEETLGYSRNTIYSMKNKKPNAERLQEIADYFNVSTDYLLGRTDNPAIAGDSKEYTWQGKPLNVEEMASNVMMFGGRELTDEKKKIIQSIIEGYLKEAGDQRYCLVTEKEIISHFQIRIIDFDGNLMPDELGFYEKKPIQLSCRVGSTKKRELRSYFMNWDTRITHAQSTKTLAYDVKTKLIE